jgi:hypothetical protein
MKILTISQENIGIFNMWETVGFFSPKCGIE